MESHKEQSGNQIATLNLDLGVELEGKARTSILWSFHHPLLSQSLLSALYLFARLIMQHRPAEAEWSVNHALSGGPSHSMMVLWEIRGQCVVL